MDRGPVDVREAYATFNMGAGFAAYVAPGDAAQVVELAKRNGYDAWVGGTVVKQDNRKAVEIVPLNITFEGDTLNVR
jgi:phosphoribosylformylglycinamidine cyclo-ligase